MRDQLNYLEKYFFKNLGLGVIDFYAITDNELSKNISKKNIKKINNFSNVQKKNSLYTPRNKKKLLLLKIIHEKKLKKCLLYQSQINLRDEFESLCQPCCNSCEKITCEFCTKFKYVYELLYTPYGPYYCKAQTLQKLLKFEIEKFRKKKIASSKKKSLIDNNRFFTNSGKNSISYASFLKQIKKFAYDVYKEPYYPTVINNVVFFQLNFEPIALTTKKEIIHSNLRNISTLFLKNHSSNKIPYKNLQVLFSMFHTEILKLLIILPNQFLPTQKSAGLDLLINKLKLAFQQNKTNLNIKRLILDNIYLYGANIGITLVKPNEAIRNAYVNESFQINKTFTSSKVFSNAVSLQHLFADCLISGISLFKCIETSLPSIHGFNNLNFNLRPTSQESEFIHSFSLDDHLIQSLSTHIDKKVLHYGNLVHLFSFHGVGVFHSFLSLIGVLNKFRMHFNLKNQFSVLYLNDFVELGVKDLILYALYQTYEKNIKQEIDEAEKDEAEKNSVIQKIRKKIEIIHEKKEILKSENFSVPEKIQIIFDYLDIEDQKLSRSGNLSQLKQIKIIKNFLYSVEDIEQLPSITNSKLNTYQRQKKKIRNSLSRNTLFKIPIRENNHVTLSIPTQKIHEMKKFTTKKNIKSDHLDLITLRFQEIAVYFDLNQLTLDSGGNFQVEKMLVNEIFLFMVFEAAIITQSEWIFNEVKECQIKEKIFQDYKKNLAVSINSMPSSINTLTFYDEQTNKNEVELSKDKYLSDSIFSFPKISKTNEVKFTNFIHVVKKNILILERRLLNTIASRNNQTTKQKNKVMNPTQKKLVTRNSRKSQNLDHLYRAKKD